MILIALGSNAPFEGLQPAGILWAALRRLEGVGVRPMAVSRLYASPAWPNPHDPPFVNAVAHVSTALTPAALLAALHAVEAGFGRERRVVNAPRTLDLDIVDFDGRVEAGDSPLLPHPRAHQRAFVLAPLADVAPLWRHPVTQEPVRALLDKVQNGGFPAFPLI